MREVLDVDACQRRGEGALGRSQRRHHHIVEQEGFGERRAVNLVGRAGSAQDIVGRDAVLLAGKFIAAARSPDAPEYPVTYEGLQDRLQMAWRQPVARRRCR